ncbi:MAG: anti-sigma factor family protein [bacterium]
MKCQKVQNKFSDFLDDQLTEDSKLKVAAHLKSCNECSAELRALQAIVAEAATFESVPAPDTLWSRIETQLDAQHESNFSKVRNWFSEIGSRISNSLPAPARQLAGVAAILVIGVMIGRYFLPKNQTEQATKISAEPSRQYTLINQRTNQYLEKSKILFLGVINADPRQVKEMDWSTEKNIAQNLVRDAAFLKDNLSEKNNAQVRLLVQDLELILLELANLEDKFDVENIEMIQSGIERQGVLLKINLYDMSEQKIVPENNLSTENL